MNSRRPPEGVVTYVVLACGHSVLMQVAEYTAQRRALPRICEKCARQFAQHRQVMPRLRSIK